MVEFNFHRKSGHIERFSRLLRVSLFANTTKLGLLDMKFLKCLEFVELLTIHNDSCFPGNMASFHRPLEYLVFTQSWSMGGFAASVSHFYDYLIAV